MKTRRKTLFIVFLLLGMGYFLYSPAATFSSVKKTFEPPLKKEFLFQSREHSRFGQRPIFFIRNKGQIDERVEYYTTGSGSSTYFTKEGVYTKLNGFQSSNFKDKKGDVSNQNSRENLGKLKDVSRSEEIIKLKPLGANQQGRIHAEGLKAGKVNYLIGNDLKKWRTQIPAYRAVRYKEIYPGIDMKFYGKNSSLKYDLIIRPGSDPEQIKLSYEGIQDVKITKEGDLEIELQKGKIFQKKPYIYQEIQGKKVEIKGNFKILDSVLNPNRTSLTHHPSPITHDDKINVPDGESPPPLFAYGFEIEDYNEKYPLIIDPTLIYSTYIGGSGRDYPYRIDVDDSGHVYITGFTNSTDFPTTKSFQSVFGGGDLDAFVVKLAPDGSDLVYATYLGGSNYDYGFDIKIDGSGNAYISGFTYSYDFPLVNPIQPYYAGGSSDGFVAKLNPNGTELVYSTFIGGSGFEYVYAITVDSSDNAYLGGSTDSPDFPLVNPLKATLTGSTDAFVSKLNSDGTALIYSTFLGGSDFEEEWGIEVDSSGNAYVTGFTGSSDFPTLNAYQPFHGGGIDVFVTKLDPSGASLLFSTYFGGSGDDYGRNIDVDSIGAVYVTGDTNSLDLPVHNPMQPGFGGVTDAFVAKLYSQGTLNYATYLGGSLFDSGMDISAGPNGKAYVTGITGSTDFPTINALDLSLSGTGDSFLAILDSTGSALDYSSFIGGSGGEFSSGISTDVSGNAYVTGFTSSADFPTTPGSFDSLFHGLTDGFVVKVGFSANLSKLLNISTRAFVGTGQEVEIGGFLIEGNEPKTVLIRGRGPSMTGAPFYVSGALTDPFVDVYDFQKGTFIARNDDWQESDPLCAASGYTCGTPEEIKATGLDPCQPNPGQSTAPPGCTNESAVLITLPPGQYGAIVSGINNGTGVGLVEVFDTDGNSVSKLGNISTRAFVGTGVNMEIGGFIIEGTDPKMVLIRGRGPSMSGGPFNLSGTLSNPYLRVYSFASGTYIARNDDWQTSDPLCGTSGYVCGGEAEIIATGLDPCQPNPGQSTAPPGCTNESAVLITLPPGQYGAIMSGVSSTTGIGLVEAFEVP